MCIICNKLSDDQCCNKNIWVSQGKAVTWVENIYTAHNFSHFAIYLPKFIEVGVNLTKF